MQYATLGDTGLVVSRFAFGAMTFGQGQMVPGVENKIDQTAADRMVARALDAGINLFDTADAYLGGQSETLLGHALREHRDAAIIATKVGFRTGTAVTDAGLSYRRVTDAAEASLRRLGVEAIDLYQLHIPDPLTPVDETLRALEDLVRHGKVRYLGVSNYPAWKIAHMLGVQEARGDARFVSAQVYHSLVGRDIEHEIAPLAEAAGLGILVWSPLASGFLTGKYTRDNPRPAGARRSAFQIPPVDEEAGYDVVDVLRQIAVDHGATPAQVALAWQMSRPFVSSVILGANSMDQLEDNLGAAELRLDDASLAHLTGMTDPAPIYPGWMEPLSWDVQVAEALAGHEVDDEDDA